MAPVINASTPARVTGTAVASVTTATFNPPATSLILAFVSQDVAIDTTATITMSNNGSATTWVSIGQIGDTETNNATGSVQANVLYTTLSAARTGMTITASTSITNELSLKCYVLTGHSTTTPVQGYVESFIASSTSFTTANFVPSTLDSLIFLNCADDAATVVPTIDGTDDAFRVSGLAGGSSYKTATNPTTFTGSASGARIWVWQVFQVNPSGVTHTGAVSLTATPTLSATANNPVPPVAASTTLTATTTLSATATRGQQLSTNLLVTTTLVPNAGQQGQVTLTATTSLSALGRITLQQLATNIVAITTLTFVQVRQTHAVAVTLTAIVILEATGSRSRAQILETRYARPPLNHPFRVIVQEILTGEIVEWDLPVSEDFNYTRQLTGPTIMQGEFKPEIISVQELGLDGFAYWLHVEIENQIRASAIFLPPNYEDSSLKFSAEGVAAAPHYTTWTTTLSSTNIDPFVVVRNIWNHVQAHPRSAYGVVVSNNLSGRRLGADAYTVTETNSTGETVTREIEAEPYELMWWEAPNCGEQIDTLAQQTPFDYKERVTWNADKTDVLHYIDLAYPRMGSPKTDIFFNEENILEVVPVQEPEDSYASEVIVIGSGEGSATIRGYAAEDFSNRVRKSFVLTDKTITTKARADAVAKSELGLRRGRLFEISEIVIRSYHANASIGEYDLGDDIYVEVDIPWMLTSYGAWYRIISISHQPSLDYIRLGLERSDSFRYPTNTQT